MPATTDTTLLSDSVINFAEAKAQQDKKCYRLEYPITTEKGEVIEELWMRRPLVRDKQVAEWQSSEEALFEVTLRLLAAVTEQPLDVMENLDSELDMAEMLDLLNKSFKSQPKVDGDTLILSYPITIKGKAVERLTLQRPKAKDALTYKNEKVREAMARLVGYRIEDLLEMDLLTDWLGLEQIYLSFRKRQPKRQQG
ncbi:phage tail assembly protein [uncultured Thiothrix sp.]|uniref:phage tail assembly protein n=1 Tax=uncultured Thiothrix sp. TaxID=223185 RepID=UPI002630B52B|nr:phage tail assembly protein [uncultured Thiothrix sp.]